MDGLKESYPVKPEVDGYYKEYGCAGPQSTLDRLRYGRVEGILPRMLGREWTNSDIWIKGNPGFVYALACPYNVMGNFGWPEIGHAGW
jgi:hypothetical protein